MFPRVDPSGWSDSKVIAQASDVLLRTVCDTWPDAYDALAEDPLTALQHIDGLHVETDPTIRGAGCSIDGLYDPMTSTITYRETSTKRDNFTLLHELGHHLLAINEDWCYDVLPALTRANKHRTVEELLVSTFASRTLIPEALTREHFTNGVTSSAVADLAEQTQASATACLVRALAEPGERLVMLTNSEGKPWFAQTTGAPFSPGIRVSQPAIEQAATRALDGTGTFRLDGGQGLHFPSGKIHPHVTFDVTVRGGLVYAVVETSRRDSRLRADSQTWTLTCVAGCNQEFTAADSPNKCSKCDEHVCPHCRGCECRTFTLCTRCTLALPTARARSGHTVCEDCE